MACSRRRSFFAKNVRKTSRYSGERGQAVREKSGGREEDLFEDSRERDESARRSRIMELATESAI